MKGKWVFQDWHRLSGVKASLTSPFLADSIKRVVLIANTIVDFL
jgi:hypothetical protein